MEFNKAILITTSTVCVFLGLLLLIDRSTHTSPDVDEMVTAVEQRFECDVFRSEQTIIAWHQRIKFFLTPESSREINHTEVTAFLASEFPSFQYVDYFELANN